MTTNAKSVQYDVVILGSGIGGTALGAILAKHGVRTLIIEELSHPRFTIGESLIPETGVRLQILSEKYGVPEIGWVGSFYKLRDHVSAACGVKRSFTFCHHRPGQPHDATHSTQLPTLTPPFGPDAHLFRQDTDAFLAAAAVQYGATLLQQVKVKSVSFSPDQVTVEAASGERFTAACLIDGGGMRSMVAADRGLRDSTPRFATNSRALYSHFVGLRPYDLFAGPRSQHRLMSPFGQATMHHMFDGGWIWVIPFNNHREATNPLASIGLMLDRRKHPDPIGTPEEEFWSHVNRYPDVARHFAGIRAVRPWTRTGRIQYSSRRLIGDRLIQLPHAAAFVDPLFSSGMSVLTVAIDIIAECLLKAVAANDYSEARFQRIEDFTQAGFDHYDMVVSRSFDAFMDWNLWNAWNRIWMLGNYLGTLGALRLLLKWYETGDRGYLEATSQPGRAGVLGSHLLEVREVMQESAKEIEEARSGSITPEAASERIFARLGKLPFVPAYYGFGDPEHRALSTFTVAGGGRQLFWYKFLAPKPWRDYGAFSLLTYVGKVVGFSFESIFDGWRRIRHAFRDFLFAQNNDWRYLPQALTTGKRLHLAVTSERSRPALTTTQETPSPKRSLAALPTTPRS